VIKSTHVRTGKGLDIVDEFARTFPAIVSETLADAANAVEPFALDELSTYPGPAVHPFQFSEDAAANRRAQMWFFANYPDGYTRTGRFGKSWRLVIDLRPGGGSVRLGSNHPEASRIVGPLNPKQSRKRQVPGHRRTGWRAKETVEFWLTAVQEEHRERLFKIMSGR
jgi:hypothetical protein